MIKILAIISITCFLYSNVFSQKKEWSNTKLDSIIDQNNYIFFGENHSYKKKNRLTAKFFFNKISENYDFVYITEAPYSLMFLINKLFHEGKINKIKEICSIDPVYKNDYYLYKYFNENNFKNNEISFVGVDVEYYPSITVFVLSSLLESNEKNCPEKIKNDIKFLKSDEDLAYLSSSDKILVPFLNNFKISLLNTDSLEYKNYLGQKTYDVFKNIMINYSENMTYPFKLPNLLVHELRDSVISNNIYKFTWNKFQLKTRLYGQLGGAHVSKECDCGTSKLTYPAVEKFKEMSNAKEYSFLFNSSIQNYTEKINFNGHVIYLEYESNKGLICY